MSKPTPIIKLLNKLESDVSDAFVRAMQELAGSVDFKAFVRYLSTGQVDRALKLLDLAPEFMSELNEELRRAYIQAGEELVRSLPPLFDPTIGGTVSGRFSAQNNRALQYLQRSAAQRVTSLSDQTRKALKEFIADPAQSNKSPRRLALDIVGRVGPGGTRQGGLIGLADNQKDWVSNLEADLRANPQRYFNRKLRNKKYDSVVRKAIKTGKPLTEDQISRLTQAYGNKVLKYRGESVARSELMRSLSAGRREGLAQMLEKGRIKDEDITREWDASEDSDTREDHANVNGTKVKGLNSTYKVGKVQMTGPHDLNAPAEQTINCRCFERISIDFIGLVAS